MPASTRTSTTSRRPTTGSTTPSAGTLQGYHAVTALGYDAGGVRVENQWGTYWGDGGWATLSWALREPVRDRGPRRAADGEPDPPPKLICQPGGLRLARPRRHADRDHRHLHREPDRLRLPVAARRRRHRRRDRPTYVTTPMTSTHRIRVARHRRPTPTAPPPAPPPRCGAITPAAPARPRAGRSRAPSSAARPSRSPTAPGPRTRSATRTSGSATRAPATRTSPARPRRPTRSPSATSTPPSASCVTARNANGPSLAPATSNALGPVAGAPPVNTAPRRSPARSPAAARCRDAGHLGRRGEHLQLPVAALRRLDLDHDRQRDVAAYTVAAGRRGLQAARAGHRQQLRRHRHRRLGPDGRRGRRAARADVGPGADRHAVARLVADRPAGHVGRRGQHLQVPVAARLGSGCTNITGATSVAYTLQPADIGASIRVQVTAHQRRRHRRPGSRDAVGPVVAGTAGQQPLPVVNGTRRPRLDAHRRPPAPGAAPGNVYSYQWQRDRRHRLGGHRRRHEGDLTSSCRPTRRAAARQGHRDQRRRRRSRPSPTETAPVAAAPPVNIGVAAASRARCSARSRSPPRRARGPARATSTPTSGSATPARASPTSPARPRTSTSSRQADVGAKLRIKVTATNPDASVAAYSIDRAAVALAAPGPGRRAGRHGHRPHAAWWSPPRRGSWLPTGATYAYQWQVDDGNGFADIRGATAANYTLTDDEAGLKVRAEITATNADGSTVGYSNALGPVLASPVNTVAPAVTGTLTDAATLHRHHRHLAVGRRLQPHLQVPVGALRRRRATAATAATRSPARPPRPTSAARPTSAPSSPCA